MINGGNESKKQAFTMLEVVIALFLLTLLGGATMSYVEIRSHGLRNTVEGADEKLRETLLQEAGLLGGPFRRTDSWGITGASAKDLAVSYPVNFFTGHGVGGGTLKVDSPHNHSERAEGYGMYLLPETASLETGVKKLSEPHVNYSGMMRDEWFPVRDLLQPAEENPFGTLYRYHWGLENPEESLENWDFGRSWEAVEIRPVLLVQAYHADPYYLPSDWVHVSFQASPPEVIFERGNGGKSVDFELREIENQSNPVVLSLTGELLELWEIRYTLDGTDPALLGTTYEGPFTPVLEPGESVLLRAVAVSKQNLYGIGNELQIELFCLEPVLIVEVEVIGEYPAGLFPEIQGIGNEIDPQAGQYLMEPNREVQLSANPGYGYQVEWQGVDRQDGNRAWVTMDGRRLVKVVFRLGLIVAILDENQQPRSIEQFRYRRADHESWSDWLEAPAILTDLEDGVKLDFDLEDLLELGVYRSLYPVKGFVYEKALEASQIILYSREPRLRAIFKGQGDFEWQVPTDAPTRLFAEMVGGGAAGAPGWISYGGYWNGANGNWVDFEIRFEAGGGGGSGMFTKGVIALNKGELLRVVAGAGGRPSNLYEMVYNGHGYEYRDGSEFVDRQGNIAVRETSLASYPKVGRGMESAILNAQTDEVWLSASGGGVAVTPHKGTGNIVSYPVGGSGGFGGGGGYILWGGEVKGGDFPENSNLHPTGGQSYSSRFEFYPFSVLEFADGGAGGAAMWWMSNVYVNQVGSHGGSGTNKVYDPISGSSYPTSGAALKGYRIALDWFIARIPSPGLINGVLRKSPAEIYRGLGSLADQRNKIPHFLDVVPAGGGGGGVLVKNAYAESNPGVGNVEVPAEIGWYSATWGNIYSATGDGGRYSTAGKPGVGFGGGGGGASAPWSHASTWQENGVLGHFATGHPGSNFFNLFSGMPSRGNYGDREAGTVLPGQSRPNARGMIGPSGGSGAPGIVVLYY